MAEIKHTPGPWRVDRNTRGIQIYGRVSGDSVRICEMVMPYRGIEDLENHKIERSAEGLANAKLIAAAPKMVVALQVAYSEMMAFGAGDSQTSAVRKIIIDALCDAGGWPIINSDVNEAIEKATL